MSAAVAEVVADVVVAPVDAGAIGAPAVIVADGVVSLSAQDESAVAELVRRLAEHVAGGVWIESDRKARTVSVVCRRDGAAWVGELGYSYGPPTATPAGLWARAVTVTARWCRPASVSERNDYAARRWVPVLTAELDRMTPAEELQWSTPVTAKGEKDPAFKPAKDLRTGHNGGRGGTPKPAPADGRLTFAPAELVADPKRAELVAAMAGRMRGLGAVQCEQKRVWSDLNTCTWVTVRPARLHGAQYATATPPPRRARGGRAAAPVTPAPAPAVVDPLQRLTADELYRLLVSTIYRLADHVTGYAEAEAVVEAGVWIDKAMSARNEKGNAA